ncbi:MAG TPA: hypothetical protein VEL07_14940 [Planctomycetota bacterium]|nr:hypothetical protein [Planctomycetota bacterium]
MRILIILAALAGSAGLAGAADAVVTESFTLADGRVLVGTYDEARGRLKVVGELSVELTVAADDIVARSPFVAEAPAEPASEPTPEPDPIDEAERDRHRIEGTLRMVERRRGEIEKYRGWAATKLEATETASAAATATLDAAMAQVAVHDQAIAALDAQSEGLKDQRALFDARMVAARARYDGDGKLEDVEVAELTQELTRMDERLRELAQRSRAAQTARRTAQGAQARAVARLRELERDAEQYRGRVDSAQRDLVANAASLERLRARLAEIDGGSARPSP